MSEGVELLWPGKLDATGQRVPVPRPGAVLRPVVSYGPTAPGDRGGEAGAEAEPNRLIEGDNLLALDALVREQPGSADLIYIDPPFATGGRFDVVRPVGPRPPRGQRGPQVRQHAYSDRWSGGVGGLLAMLDPRLRLAHALLAPHGSLYVHVDPTVGHAVKLMLDEIFGPGCFQREIVWRIGWVSGFKTRARNWIRNHDLLFFYVKDPAAFTFNKRYLPHPPGYLRRDGSPPKGKGVPLDDVWNAGDAELSLRGRASLDSIQIKSFSTEKTGYATQKNESLLERIIEASSNPGDRVVDVFCGSGTTLAVAERLGRRWIGCDVGRSAVHIATARLLACARARGFEVARVERPGEEEPGVDDAVVEQARAAYEARVGDDASRLEVVPIGRRLPFELESPSVVAAWRWSAPVPWLEEDGVVRVETSPAGPPALVLQRGAAAGQGTPPPIELFERGHAVITLHGLAEGRAWVEVEGVHYLHTALRPEVLRGLDPWPDSIDLVEWWTVRWGAGLEVDEVLGRFERDRVLPRRSTPHALEGRTACVVVQLYDVVDQVHQLTCRLVKSRGRWQVVEAQIDTGA